MFFVSLSDGSIGWLQLSHLFALGFQEEHVYFILIFLGIIVSYAVIKPIITWFVALQSIRLLSYLTSGLIVIMIFFLIVLFIGKLPDVLFSLLKITLQCLAVWGIAIILHHSFQQVVKK